MADQKTPVLGNPGFAGETGQFEVLTESDVRGTAYYAGRPVEGGHPGGAGAYPFQLATRQPDAPLFEGPYRERLNRILSRYPTPQGALLPALALAQEIRGHLDADAMARVAEALNLSPTYVRGVATFYTMYNKAPVGDYLIQVCTNVACNLCGADDVMSEFLEMTGVEPGVTTSDGAFTVIEAECLGACGFPTAVQINERYFENVEPELVPEILKRLRAERAAARSAGAAAAGSSAGQAGTGAARDYAGPAGPIEVPEDPGAPGRTVGPEANPYAGRDRTPPAPARPPATDEPASEGQG
jgi:NADH-quinone oxidoreductase E subunit